MCAAPCAWRAVRRRAAGERLDNPRQIEKTSGIYARPAAGQFIAVHRKPHTALRRFAVQPRTVFSGAPCLKLSVNGYTYTLSAQVYVNDKGRLPLRLQPC